MGLIARLITAATLCTGLLALVPGMAQAAICGNGVLEGSENCDDGNIINGDGCDSACHVEECGNGFVQAGESCDPGTGTTTNPALAAANGPTCDNDCTPVTCGDAHFNGAAETCDESTSGTDASPNPVNTATCDADCTSPGCGDGFLNPANSEICDDGNATSGDGCDSNCTPTACGNGILTTGESCDDGNATNGDGCDDDTASGGNCTATGCGNGVLTAPEVCDDGNTVGGDGCSFACNSLEECGNGIVDFFESCDPGTGHAGGAVPGSTTGTATANSASCDLDCTAPACGDGIANAPAGEACDDGNTVSADGCRADCLSDETCGNGKTDFSAGESCDPGTGHSGDGGSGVPGTALADSASCDLDCTAPVCGDGHFNPVTEPECDDGNTIDDDACNTGCFLNICGNGIINFVVGGGGTLEACDDGNLVDDDGCDSNCTPTGCGNGIVTSGEFCDDGNNTSGDGCRSDCLSDESCGNGLLDSGAGEACDEGTGANGAPVPADGPTCDSDCTVNTCGDGHTNPNTEECDDGNSVANDSCRNACLLNICGNGRIDWIIGGSQEDCDAGDLNNPGPVETASCDDDCTSVSCGDGTLNTSSGEVCDDGNVASGDGCRSDCLSDEKCGNGLVDLGAGELCDPNTGNSGIDPGFALAGTATCTQACTPSFCGDTIPNAGASETCDDGATCLDGTTPCTLLVCNGSISGVCECSTPSNCTAKSGDGCSGSCKSEQCGDGVVDAGEDCDPGTGVLAQDPSGNPAVCTGTFMGLFDGLPCTTDVECPAGSCTNDLSTPAASSTASCDADCTDVFCGDGFVNGSAGEQCDDLGLCGNLVTICTEPAGSECGSPATCEPRGDDGCGPTCQNEFCGDGITQASEDCDPGGADAAGCDGPGAAAGNECTFASCGDGHVNTADEEECDDGNTTGDDGCSATCATESCGNGLVEGPEVCDDGGNDDGDGCSANCLSDETCGNGILDTAASENCDDGATCLDGTTVCTLMVCNGTISGACECSTPSNCTAKDGDGCSSGCLSEVCGDGQFPGVGKECDDGNDVQDDGCTNLCEVDPDEDGLIGPSDTCETSSLASGKLKIGRLDLPGETRVTLSGEFSAPSGVDPTNDGVHIKIQNGTTVLYEVSIAGNLAAPGGEYMKGSSNPACGSRRDGWTAKVGSKTRYRYLNKTGLAPSGTDTVDGTCTGDAKGVRRVDLTDNGDGTWRAKVVIKGAVFDDVPALTAGPIDEIAGTLQAQIALGEALSTSQSSAGAAGECMDMQFDGSIAGDPIPVTSCKVRTRLGAVAKVSCRAL